MRRIVLLPGLDGTGTLFDDFVRAAPRGVQLDVVALPQEPLGYSELAARLTPRLRLDAKTIVIAESFSGPLAIHLTEHRQPGALVLCNSFVVPPVPRALRVLPLSPFFRLPLPDFLTEHYLVGADAPDALLERVRTAVASVPASVLAARVSSVLRVDVAELLGRFRAPLLYLRGTKDRVVGEASVRVVVEAAPAPVSVVRISGPHLLLQVAPDAAWRAIEAFLLEARLR